MSNRGFSKIEIIIVVFVILLFVAGDIFASRYLAAKTKDVKVLSEISEIRSGLELYSYLNNFYPQIAEPTTLNDSYVGTEKLCREGFERFSEKCTKVLMDKIPNFYYSEGNRYLYQAVNNYSDYLLEFNLETDFPELQLTKGKKCATNLQILNKSCY